MRLVSLGLFGAEELVFSQLKAFLSELKAEVEAFRPARCADTPPASSPHWVPIVWH